VIEGLLTEGGEFVRTPKGGRGAVSAHGLIARLQSRTLFLVITVVELALGMLMLGGAIYFGRHAMEYIAWVLVVKAAGFLGLAALSTSDLLPREQVVRV
jgi:hypothetical protein